MIMQMDGPWCNIMSAMEMEELRTGTITAQGVPTGIEHGQGGAGGLCRTPGLLQHPHHPHTLSRTHTHPYTHTLSYTLTIYSPSHA